MRIQEGVRLPSKIRSIKFVLPSLSFPLSSIFYKYFTAQRPTTVPINKTGYDPTRAGRGETCCKHQFAGFKIPAASTPPTIENPLEFLAFFFFFFCFHRIFRKGKCCVLTANSSLLPVPMEIIPRIFSNCSTKEPAGYWWG